MSVWPVILPGTSDGKTIKYSQPRLAQALRGSRPCAVNIVIERLNATRSVQANNFYWLWMGLLEEHTGYTKDEMHALLKAMFLPKKITLADKEGEIVEEVIIGTTTTKLTKQEFGVYLDQVRAWAFEKLDVALPEADPALRKSLS